MQVGGVYPHARQADDHDRQTLYSPQFTRHDDGVEAQSLYEAVIT